MQRYDSVNMAWISTMLKLANEGQPCSPRGQNILELKNYSICVTNPKKRLVSNPIRKMSLPFAFGELLWYLGAKNDVATMKYYASNIDKFSDDGITLNSAYGYRIFGKHPQINFDQWEHVVEKLKSDPDSRQAIIHLHTPNNKKTKDEVCTLTLQFMIRDGKLDMFVNMRSNDIVWGFTYDAFSFTSFQELLANELGIEMGDYYHNAASMHIYEKDFEMLNNVKKYAQDLAYFANYDFEFDYGGLTLHNWLLKEVMLYETFARGTKMPVPKRMPNPALDVMCSVFYKYSQHKNNKEIHFDYDNIYDVMLRNGFQKKPLNESRLTILEGPDGSGKTTYCSNMPDFTRVHFAKPDETFNPLIYFNTILSCGDLILDRSFISEIIYSKFYNRIPRISTVYFDKLLRTLHRRDNFNLIFLIPTTTHDTEIAYYRLAIEDSYSKEDYYRLCNMYCNLAIDMSDTTNLNITLSNIGGV